MGCIEKLKVGREKDFSNVFEGGFGMVVESGVEIDSGCSLYVFDGLNTVRE